MTLIQLLLTIVLFIVLGGLAFWAICKFFSEPLRGWILAIVGIVLLIFLLVQFFPGAANYRVIR